MKKILSALAVCVALFSSGSASAASNCGYCLQLWNVMTWEVWSCSNPNNPSGGHYGIIASDKLAIAYPRQCSDSKWCAATCAPTERTNWWGN